MRALVARYQEAYRIPGFVTSSCTGIALFAAAFCINLWSIQQATAKAGAGMEDIILSNIPLYNVDDAFVYGTFLVAAVSFAVVLAYPKRIPFAFKAVAMFIIIRSMFALMTHLGPPEAVYVTQFGETITRSFFGADQFFSAHTGMPFLGALAFWGISRREVAFFLGSSLFFAAIVLMGHIHYTIDVFSAFFITYGIFHIARWVMPREWALFKVA